MKLKLTLVSIIAIIGLVLPGLSLAADFSVRLGQPKSPTSQDNFKLTFVALDTVTSGRQITVKCYKKGPSDGSFSQFDTTKTMIVGGNTDSCDVTSSILSANGDYSFKVIASVSEPSYQELPSATVTVNYNTSGPNTPVNYSKERLNSCDYKIKFKTADDGKTTKVQVFRSDTLSIHVDAGAVLTSVNISPNTEGEITNSVPVCGKDYYYVIRAVDSSDNASGTIGDSFTTTTTTTTTTSGAVAGSQTGATGAIVLSDGSAQITEPGQPGSNASEPGNSQTPTPTILGTTADEKKRIPQWLLITAAVLVGYFISKSLRRSKSK